MAKYALHYASHHPKLQDQVELHSAVVQFYRPVFPTSVITMTLREVNIGKAVSTLRVELSQEDKIACSAELASRFKRAGVSPSNPVKSISQSSPQTAIRTGPPITAPSTPTDSVEATPTPRLISLELSFLEQWVKPGWDCLPQGSRTPDTNDNARWTNEMLQFVAGMALPIQENFLPHEEGQALPMGRLAATLAFAARQQTAREEGQRDWRVLPDDGSREFPGAKLVSATVTLCTEIKQKLPAQGVRWLYLHTGCKRIVDGRMDLEVLVFDEHMGLVAIGHQTVVLVPAAAKIRKV